MSGHSLLQGIFLTQGWNPGLLYCRQILYCLSHKGSPFYTIRLRLHFFQAMFPPKGIIPGCGSVLLLMM